MRQRWTRECLGLSTLGREALVGRAHWKKRGHARAGSKAAGLYLEEQNTFFVLEETRVSLLEETRVRLAGNGARAPRLRPSYFGMRSIAVVTAGSFRRYFLASLVAHVFKPLVAQNNSVHYYLHLVTTDQPTWRQSPYLQHLTWDTLFGPPKQDRPTDQQIATVIHHHVQQVGAKLVKLTLTPSVDLNDDPRIQARRAAAKRQYPFDDPDQRFPVQSKGNGRAAAANRNILRLFRAIEHLYNELEAFERRQGSRYTDVLFIRDDAHFLADFNLTNLFKRAGSASLYVLACDDRSPQGGAPMLPTEMNDHAQFLQRSHAHVIGRYYSRFFELNASRCSSKLYKRRLRQWVTRPCTSEELLQWNVRDAGLQYRQVVQEFLPFQRAAHVRTMIGVQTCFHKYCQSKKHKLDDSGMKVCFRDKRIMHELPPPGYWTCQSSQYTQEPVISNHVSFLHLFPLQRNPKDYDTLRTEVIRPTPKPKRVAIYTVVTSGYDPYVSYNCAGTVARMSAEFRQWYEIECFFYTDSTSLARNASAFGWNAVVFPKPLDTKKEQRRMKILGNLAELRPFEYVIYHDGKCGPFGTNLTRFGGVTNHLDVCRLEEQLYRAIGILATPMTRYSPSIDLVVFEHPKRNSTKEEVHAVAAKRLCSETSYNKILNTHRAAGYPDNVGLADTMTIVRRWGSDSMWRAMKMWWDEMTSSNCMRDQLSFEYAAWKSGLNYAMLPGPTRPFNQVKKHHPCIELARRTQGARVKFRRRKQIVAYNLSADDCKGFVI